MHGRYGSAEATQDQILVCVVPYVPDRHVMEKMTVCAQDVVGPVSHLLYPAEHTPCPYFPQPRLAPWEEMCTPVLKNRRGQGCRDRFIPHVSLW